MTTNPGPGWRGDPRLRTVAIAVAVIGLAGALAMTMRPLIAPTSAPGGAPVATAPPDPVSSPRPPATESAEVTRAGKQPRKRKAAQQAKPKRRAKPKPATQPTEAAVPAAPPVDTKLRPFTGLSTWIDIYDTGTTPQQQLAAAAAGGVQLIYVQSARHKSKTDIEDPVRLGQVIDLAHANGMLVMVWYVPDFVRTERDLRRAKTAIAFQSPGGERADAFGLDIEVEDQPDLTKRTEALLTMSRRLREWAGPDYPMAAVVLPPLQLELRQGWWPNFPWAQLRPFYDAFVPMSYSSYRGTDKRTTYRWNVVNVQEMRKLVGDPALPVHLAGGIADNFPEVGTFVRAVRDSGSLGGGLYDLSTTHPDAWPILARLRAPAP